jgi:hypothetical protein
MKGICQFVAFTVDVDLLEDNTDTINKNTKTLSNASTEVDLQINAEKTKYMLLFSHQNAHQNHYIKVANISYLEQQ